MNSAGELSHFPLVLVGSDSEREGQQVCTRLDKAGVQRVLRVELNVARASLGSGPEGLTFLVLVVRGEHVEQVLDLMVKVLIEMKSGHLNALLISGRSLHFYHVLD